MILRLILPSILNPFDLLEVNVLPKEADGMINIEDLKQHDLIMVHSLIACLVQ